jgi:predicted PolB exonuclease-like 3'-5' exonuclease
LLHGVVAERYWEVGESNNNFRYNNYISRYHYRHTDLMDLLAAYQSQCKAPLEEIALMLGLPGKMGMHGSKVMEQYFAGEIENIRNYCETDVLNTHLVYYRFLLMQGKLTEEQYQFENQQVRNFLINANKPHLAEFNSLWK